MSDRVERLRAAGHDERLADGPLYLDAADEIEQLRGERNIARIDLANMDMRLRHRDAEIAELRAELTTAEAALESLQNKWASRPLSVEDTAALERENDALRADAERYRWLRGSPLQRGKCFSFDGMSLKCGSDLDEAIDAAMKEQQP